MGALRGVLVVAVVCGSAAHAADLGEEAGCMRVDQEPGQGGYTMMGTKQLSVRDAGETVEASFGPHSWVTLPSRAAGQACLFLILLTSRDQLLSGYPKAKTFSFSLTYKEAREEKYGNDLPPRQKVLATVALDRVSLSKVNVAKMKDRYEMEPSNFLRTMLALAVPAPGTKDSPDAAAAKR